MFRDDKQAHQAIRRLLSRLPTVREAWTLQGPTEQAYRWLESGAVLGSDRTSSSASSPHRGVAPSQGDAIRARWLATGELLLLRVAFDLWNGRGNAALGRVLDVLDARHLADIGSLLVAVAEGPSAVDAWIGHGSGRAVTSTRSEGAAK